MTEQTETARIALVTGAARRIGRAIALALARDGWDVALHYATSQADALSTVHEIEQIGRRAVAIARDLADESGVATLVDDCAAALGPLCCVVNNASAFEEDAAANFSPELLARMMRINAAAPIVLAQRLHAQLPAGASGVAVNLLDQKLWNPNPDFLSYTLSKAALKEATRLLAQALAPKLRVVGVAPGTTLASTYQTAEGFAAAHAATPLGRASTAGDIAQAVVYAVNARAVTGTTLIVDGGQHLVPTGRDILFLTEHR